MKFPPKWRRPRWLPLLSLQLRPPVATSLRKSSGHRWNWAGAFLLIETGPFCRLRFLPSCCLATFTIQLQRRWQPPLASVVEGALAPSCCAEFWNLTCCCAGSAESSRSSFSGRRYPLWLRAPSAR